MSTSTGNKRIAINTAIIYVRMLVVTLIGLCTTRYVLQALGISDYGLFNVVAGLVTMLNVISIAMHTTTRRYINVEMGKPNGDLNKIFNICLMLHVGLALLILLLAETIGLCYIYNFLNIDSGKLSDAIFVFHLSIFISVLGIINVPYQGLLDAYEKFGQMALIDFSTTILKIPLVVLLIHYQGNALRFYTVGVCVLSFISFVLYQCLCYKQHYSTVRLKRILDKELYREILVFNNYTALGALAYIGRTQGSTMIINYFFGTIVNGAFAIANQIENFIVMFVNNLSTASEPQITQSYSAGDMKRTFHLAEKISKYSIFIMLLIVFPVSIKLEFLLSLWLGEIPNGSLVLCYWMLISLFIRSLTTGIPPIIQATGKVKWFQIAGSSFLLMGLPLSFIFLKLGKSPESVIVTFIFMDLLNRLFNLWLVNKITDFCFVNFVKSVYYPALKVTFFLSLYLFLYLISPLSTNPSTIVSTVIFLFSTLYVALTIFYAGLGTDEKRIILSKVKSIYKKL